MTTNYGAVRAVSHVGADRLGRTMQHHFLTMEEGGRAGSYTAMIEFIAV
jgi:hypothetical protein